jgi:predicted  nucleic acid-binding Zn-ribbon protein
MAKEIRTLGHIKTLMGTKHRSLPKAERANDAEIYLLRNNLSVSLKELVSINQRKKAVETRIQDIETRIADLEAEDKEKRAQTPDNNAPKRIKSVGNMKVMKIDY